MFHTCSREFMSGYCDGHSIKISTSNSKNWLIMQALRIRALQFIKKNQNSRLQKQTVKRCHLYMAQHIVCIAVTVPREKGGDQGGHRQQLCPYYKTTLSVCVQFVDVASRKRSSNYPPDQFLLKMYLYTKSLLVGMVSNWLLCPFKMISIPI